MINFVKKLDDKGKNLGSFRAEGRFGKYFLKLCL